jgi:hypothetical protein
MTKIDIAQQAGDFAEDKDLAASIREGHLRPAVTQQVEITLNFSGVRLVTQSFVHALISDVLRQNGEDALKYIVFKGCSQGVRGIVETVVQYSLESTDSASEPDRKPVRRKVAARKKR